MKSGAINIDEYIGGASEEQFDFIYTHFSIIKNLFIDYKEDLVSEVM